jgi:hypothetical protein
MKTRLLVSMIFVVICIQAEGTESFDQYFFRKTLRVDYTQTGNYANGKIRMDRLISEPFWGGSLVNLIDTFGYGRYYFELLDGKTDKVIYSRGYSTLFVEWQDTEEAKKKSKSFRESVVMPFPRDVAILKIYYRDKQNNLHQRYSYKIDPSGRKIKPGKTSEWKTKDISIQGDPSEKLDIVFIAEGYTREEMDLFWQDCEKFKGYLFGASPFNDCQKKINIRGIGAISKESGVSLPGEKIFRNTALGVSYYTFGSERYLMAEDYQRVRDVAAAVPYDQIFIIVNSDRYGGGGIYNFYATGARGNKEAAFLFIHEFGHSFAGLADEYYTSEVSVEDFYDLKTEPWEPNITTLVNFSSKWEDMLIDGTPVPTPNTPEVANRVGVFEGAGYSAKGVYRPMQDCTMKSVKYDAFCPVCKRAIIRMIDFYSTP